MNKLRPYKKEKYHRESTIDLSDLKQMVNPELKKRSDELIKVLVDNLNRNTTKSCEADSEDWGPSTLGLARLVRWC